MDRIDDLLGDDEEAEAQPEAKPETKDNKAFAQMRKELAAVKKEAEELRTFRAEREKADRDNAISGVFQEVGLNPKHAKLFSALNPEGDVTPEAVAGFASEYGLVTSEGEEVETPAPADRGFTPTVISEGQAVGAKVYTAEEALGLAENGEWPKLEQLYKSGRVKMDRLPGNS